MPTERQPQENDHLDPIGIVTKVADWAIEKFRQFQKPQAYQNPHFFPANWKNAGMPSGTMCYWCKREYPQRGRYDKPYCDNR